MSEMPRWGLGIFEPKSGDKKADTLNLDNEVGNERPRTPEEVLKERASKHWESWTRPAHRQVTPRQDTPRQVIPRQEAPPAVIDQSREVIKGWKANLNPKANVLKP